MSAPIHFILFNGSEHNIMSMYYNLFNQFPVNGHEPQIFLLLQTTL